MVQTLIDITAYCTSTYNHEKMLVNFWQSICFSKWFYSLIPRQFSKHNCNDTIWCCTNKPFFYICQNGTNITSWRNRSFIILERIVFFWGGLFVNAGIRIEDNLSSKCWRWRYIWGTLRETYNQLLLLNNTLQK